MAKQRRTVTRTLLLLVAALTLPIMGFTAFILVRHAFNEQNRYSQQAEQVAGFVGEIVDKELSNFAALLRGAANSTALLAGDLETFHTEALRLVAGTDMVILLRTRAGQQLLHTDMPYGSDIPAMPSFTPSETTALDQREAVIGGIYRSPVSGELRVPIAMPLTVGNDQLVVAITAPASYFWQVIAPAAPPGWVLTIADNNNRIVARSQENEVYAGEDALPGYLDLVTGPQGSFRVNGFGGRALLTGYSRSSFSNWMIGANIPVDMVEAPLRQSLGGIIAVALVAATAALAISAAFIRRFRRASKLLLQHASDTGTRPVAAPSTGLNEFDEVIDALSNARAQRCKAERALQLRTQELEVVLERAPAAVWFTYDSAKVKRVRSNATAAHMLRIPPDSDLSIASGQMTHLQVYWNGAPCPHEQLPLDRALRGEHLRDEEYVFRFDDGTEMTLLTSAEPLRDTDGAISGSVSVGIDISERKRNDERQKLLINELNHRVKNTLTTVQSIARRSLRTAATLNDAERSLSERLIAISRAYDVLTRELWQGSSVFSMLQSTVGGYAQPSRLKLHGPDFRLSSSNSVTFSLIVHELAVNATKYGALSVDTGHLDVSWSIEPLEDADLLTLTWRELGGPPVKPPTRSGFGSDLLRRLTDSGGTAHSLDFAPSGLVCTFSLRQPHASETPLDQTLAGAAVG